MAPKCLSGNSIARVWDEEILSAIRIDKPHPPVHARNLFSLSVAMYDAWAAYDSVSVGYVYRVKHLGINVEMARREAISYAAYRILRERYALSLNANTTLAALDARMTALGYDKDFTATDTLTPAGVGNSVAAAVSAFFIDDGARQLQAYADYPVNQGGYVPINQPLVTGLPGTTVVDVNHWQRLTVTNAQDQNGNPTGTTQSFLGAQWLGVRSFALTRTDATQPWIDPGPQPLLGGVGDAQFRSEVVDLILRSSEMTPDDGVTVDISPGVFGDNTLGANNGDGHPTNPSTGLPYAPDVVKRGDFTRVLAEFWADGPNSETPPGHWNTIANSVSGHSLVVKRLGGTGRVLDDLEWDVKLYFVLNAALHDAACAAWSLKRYYDGGRPIESIRYMAGLGQSSDSTAPSYHPNGLPLVPGLIELVTATTAQVGERHAGLPVGSIALHAWPGQPANTTTSYSGVRWIQAVNWFPYQKATFVTPAFPGYISGHSTFSRSAAEILAAITGTPYFPGGIGTYTAPAGTSLTFEKGPSQSVQLQWGTYFDAADQAGLSRLWGGIHVPADDLTGRRIGSQCGKGVWAAAQKYFDGSVVRPPAGVVHDLATVGILAPKTVTLTQAHPRLVKPVVAVIQNRGPQTEIIPDAEALGRLVQMQVESLGSLLDRHPLLVPPNTFPITLKSKRKLNVVFTAIFDGANDPALTTKTASHTDFRYHATVYTEALNGAPDDFHADDLCPHDALPGGKAPNPDGTIVDRGSGAKKPDGTFGGDVLTDVYIKAPATNLAPVLAPLNQQTINVGTTFSVLLVATDLNQDPLTFSALPAPLPPGASLDGKTGSFTFTPNPSQVGPINFKFTVSDGLLADSQSLKIVVKDGSPLLQVGTPEILSSKVTGPQEVEYTLKVDLTNRGPAIGSVKATLSSTPAHTTIVDGDVSFGPLASLSTTTSSDTFVVRHDRRVHFSLAAFRWTLSFAPPAPSIGPTPSATNLTAFSISGVAYPNSNVEVTGGASPATTVADAQGKFFAFVSLQLNQINHLQIVASQPGGRPSPPALVDVTQN